MFAGYVVSEHGFCPNPALTQAIREFPQPSNVNDLCSFFGLCQQIGNFRPKIAAALAPLAPLLKKNSAWSWTPEPETAFVAARTKLVIVPESAFYDPSHPTALFVDAFRLNGLGFILKQRVATGNWHIVQTGSRFLRPPETRHTMIELEC